MTKIFPPKSGCVTFYPLSMSNFMQKINKILWPVIEKKSERTDERTWVNLHIGPTSQVGGSKKIKLIPLQQKRYLRSVSWNKQRWITTRNGFTLLLLVVKMLVVSGLVLALPSWLVENDIYQDNQVQGVSIFQRAFQLHYISHWIQIKGLLI